MVDQWDWANGCPCCINNDDPEGPDRVCVQTGSVEECLAHDVELYAPVAGPMGRICKDNTGPGPTGGCWFCEIEGETIYPGCCYPGTPVYQWLVDVLASNCSILCGGHEEPLEASCIAGEWDWSVGCPCCIKNTAGGHADRICYQKSSPEDCLASYSVEMFDPIPGPMGRICHENAGAGLTGGCWKCYEPHAYAIPGCCFPDPQGYQWVSMPLEVNCTMATCEGYPEPWESKCVPSYPDPECLRASDEDQPSFSKLRWTIDILAPLAFGDDRELDYAGRLKLCSATLSRAHGNPTTDVEAVEPCSWIGGILSMRDDGLVYADICSQPKLEDPASQRLSFGALWTATEDDIGFHAGCQYDLGCVHLPWWTEAMYRSRLKFCVGPHE